MSGKVKKHAQFRDDSQESASRLINVSGLTKQKFVVSKTAMKLRPK